MLIGIERSIDIDPKTLVNEWNSSQTYRSNGIMCFEETMPDKQYEASDLNFWMLIISVATGIVSNVVYDFLKGALSRRGFRVESPVNKEKYHENKTIYVRRVRETETIVITKSRDSQL